MAYVVEVPVAGDEGAPDGVIKVAIEEAPQDGLVKVARPGQVVARATRSLGDLLAGVRPVAQHFVEGFSTMAHAPDEITVEFGLSLSAQADVVVSSTSAQANFKVCLTWNRESAGGAGTAASSPAP
ncbi:CU044_2847 family protein [Streptomyces sp. TS71-3]|uniref:CU044_2847 family protein n=1 Tax=Streptomyces sp. TS71-3 TaxID=2733862 RepID=UPI001B197209|nr:CU044_2847 family protein [Streptomyces sp. TS71-3]GHJ39786.1 hypothetical protein Sm713_53950 [Streptomyces sp. TS71-3]